MEVWQLAVSLVGVIAAFIVSFFAEPIKLFFANRHEREQLRKALYKEIGFMYARLANISNSHPKYDWETFKKSLKAISRTEAYDYAKSKPMLFYQLKEASSITQIYANFNMYFDGFLFNDVDEHIENALPVLEIVEKLVIDDDLNKALFLRTFSKENQTKLRARLATLSHMQKQLSSSA